ncbi:chromate efflux transporter [Fulvimarina sp. MAC3]|uniref:chromate efflux transporter n=1 Tax=Fulvimarina sp. MAC3 TaxID=3148887 RepID=UPI0031FC3D80
MTDRADPRNDDAGAYGEIVSAFGKLGFTAFGGPIAHIGYFREEFVTRRKWLTDAAFADLLALCQFLPGPASSQVGFAIGLSRGGFLGALLAWCAFTLPSALALMLFALGVGMVSDGFGADIIGGLKITAVAVVAHALLGMAKTLTPEPRRATIAVLAIALLALLPGASGQIVAILAGGIAGVIALSNDKQAEVGLPPIRLPKTVALTSLGFFAALLSATLFATGIGPLVDFLAGIYRAGALVFGGGHVVLPLLSAETVAPGYISEDAFLAGYGAAQAVPGPLFTFAAFLGTEAGGLLWGLLALAAIFLPGIMLLIGVLPFWHEISASPRLRSALSGANAAVVGILAAALYDPVFTSAILDLPSFALAAFLFVLLNVWKTPPILVVALGAIGGPLVL